MFSVRTFTLFKYRYYAHFWHYAGWQELANSNAIAKAASNSSLDSQTYDGGSQISAVLLALANQHSAKNGRNIDI